MPLSHRPETPGPTVGLRRSALSCYLRSLMQRDRLAEKDLQIQRSERASPPAVSMWTSFGSTASARKRTKSVTNRSPARPTPTRNEDDRSPPCLTYLPATSIRSPTSLGMHRTSASIASRSYGAEPLHIRAIAAAVGCTPPARRSSPAKSRHTFDGTVAGLKPKNQDFTMERADRRCTNNTAETTPRTVSRYPAARSTHRCSCQRG